MGAENVKTEFSIFGIAPNGSHTCLAYADTLEGIHAKYKPWVDAVAAGNYNYVSLEIRRTQREVIRKSTFVVTVKEE